MTLSASFTRFLAVPLLLFGLAHTQRAYADLQERVQMADASGLNAPSAGMGNEAYDQRLARDIGIDPSLLEVLKNARSFRFTVKANSELRDLPFEQVVTQCCSQYGLTRSDKDNCDLIIRIDKVKKIANGDSYRRSLGQSQWSQRLNIGQSIYMTTYIRLEGRISFHVRGAGSYQIGFNNSVGDEKPPSYITEATLKEITNENAFDKSFGETFRQIMAKIYGADADNSFKPLRWPRDIPDYYYQSPAHVTVYYAKQSISGKFDGTSYFPSELPSGKFLVPELKSSGGFGIGMGGRYKGFGGEGFYRRASFTGSWYNHPVKATYHMAGAECNLYISYRRPIQPYLSGGLFMHWLTVGDGFQIASSRQYSKERFNVGAGLLFGAGIRFYLTQDISFKIEVENRQSVFTRVNLPGQDNSENKIETLSANGWGVCAGIMVANFWHSRD